MLAIIIAHNSKKMDTTNGRSSHITVTAQQPISTCTYQFIIAVVDFGNITLIIIINIFRFFFNNLICAVANTKAPSIRFYID